MVCAMEEQQAEIELLKTLIQQQQDLINSLTEKVEAINTQKL